MFVRRRIARAILRLVIVGVLAIGISFTTIIYLRYFEDNFNYEYLSEKPGDKKIILFGSNWWHAHYPFLDQTKSMCPNCIFTEDSRMFEISDAVVFHGFYLREKYPEPPVNRRGKNQIWVWLNFETTDYLGYVVNDTINYANMFNWTMTYRHDSDVHVPYGRFVSFLEDIPVPKYEETWAFIPSALPDKTGIYDHSFMNIPALEDFKERKMVAWIVSHCNSSSKRELIAKKLSKYIQVDIFGTCGNLTCNVGKSEAMSGIDCKFQLSRKYKFYLAFENSICEDYVTEKYFDTLFTEMIPVVYGGANYSRIVPYKSYINVHDFKDVKELATYLKYLASHPEEFLKYFMWRKSYWVQNNRFVTGYCDLCKKLWNIDNRNDKFYNNLTEWWYGRSDFKISGQHACVKPNAYITENIKSLDKLS